MKRVAVVLAGVLLLGCSGLSQMGLPDDLTGCEAYIDFDTMPVWAPDHVIQGNATALNDEDLDCYMGLFHPDSAQIAGTYIQTSGLFEQFDLEASFAEPLKVEYVGSDQALVTFVQLTKNNNAESFDASRSRGVHTMKKDSGGRWRLIQTVITVRDPWDGSSP